MPDLTITPANVLKGSTANTSSGIAGETITAGKSLYLKAADGRLWLAQCDATAEESQCVGIALNAATAGQPVVFVSDGPMNIGATTVKTTTYMVGAAAGGICPQADLIATNRVTEVGYATDITGGFVVHIVKTGVQV
jgi:hypothetical protein